MGTSWLRCRIERGVMGNDEHDMTEQIIYGVVVNFMRASSDCFGSL
jgi:hypothetical protein